MVAAVSIIYHDNGCFTLETPRDEAIWTLRYLALPVNRWGAFLWWIQGGTFRGMLNMWRVL